MAILTKDNVWRDYVTDGIPSSGVYNPDKAQIRQYMGQVEVGASLGALIYSTKALLDANTGADDNQMAWVVADATAANNGIYQSASGAWTRLRGFPDTAAVLTNIAGTANAITADTESGVDPAEIQILILPDPPGTNTSTTVTLALNGGSAESIKAASGSNLAIGDIVEGVGTIFFRVGAEWRQLVSSGVIAQAELAAAAAEAARDEVTDALAPITLHIDNTSNPHQVTKSQVGLGNVDNTSDVDKPVSTAQQAALDLKADLVAGKVPTSQLPDAVLGAVRYQGTWNATTNAPTIPAAAAGNKGYYYIVTVAGSTSIDGEDDWEIGDWIISDGTAWSKVDNSEVVVDGNYHAALVFGQTAKATPVNADTFFLTDSAASNGPKKITWQNLKASVLAAPVMTGHGSITSSWTVGGFLNLGSATGGGKGAQIGITADRFWIAPTDRAGSYLWDKQLSFDAAGDATWTAEGGFKSEGALTVTTGGIAVTGGGTIDSNTIWHDGNAAEKVDDRVGALLQAGTNITLDYNDAANTLTISGSGTVSAAAVDVSVTPTGGISSNNAQAALAELDTEKAPKLNPQFTGDISLTDGSPRFDLVSTTGTGGTADFRLGGGNGELASINIDPNNVTPNSLFILKIDNSEVMRALGSGKVGWGTTNPLAKQHVAGTGRYDGALTVTAGGFNVTGNSTLAGSLNLTYGNFAGSSPGYDHVDTDTANPGWGRWRVVYDNGILTQSVRNVVNDTQVAPASRAYVDATGVFEWQWLVSNAVHTRLTSKGLLAPAVHIGGSGRPIQKMEYHGGVSGNATTDTAAFAAAIAALPASGGAIELGAGTTLLSSLQTINAAATANILIEGKPGLSKIETRSTGGAVKVVFAGAAASPANTNRRLTVQGIKFVTNQTDAGWAIDAEWPENTGEPGRLFTLRDCDVEGVNQASAHYFTGGLRLTRAKQAYVSGLNIKGQSVNTNMSYGIYLDDCVQAMFDQCVGYHLDTMLDIRGGSEGIYWYGGSVAVTARRGIHWETYGETPYQGTLLCVQGAHFSCTELAVHAVNVAHLDISGGLYQKREGTSQNYAGILVQGSSLKGMIRDVVFSRGASSPGANNAVIFGTGVSAIQVHHNLFEFVDTGIWLQTGSSGCLVESNQALTSVTTLVNNQGTGNTIRNNVT